MGGVGLVDFAHDGHVIFAEAARALAAQAHVHDADFGVSELLVGDDVLVGFEDVGRFGDELVALLVQRSDNVESCVV